MKRLLIFSVALAFVVGALGISNSIAQNPEFKNTAEMCKFLRDNPGPGVPPYEFESLGECISWFRTSPVKICKMFAADLGMTVGECVRMSRPNNPPLPPVE